MVTVRDLVEKPAPADAPSNWIIIGRYVCDPAVFGVLEDTPPGRGNEIQLTDALKTLAQMPASEGGGVRGVQFRGRRFDTGNPVDYLRTIIQFALRTAGRGRRVPAVAAEVPGRPAVTDMDPVETHLARVLAAIRPVEPARLGLEAAEGAVLAADAAAMTPLPSFDNSSMDGYAVHAADIAAATAKRRSPCRSLTRSRPVTPAR